jgi:hypothetical protein
MQLSASTDNRPPSVTAVNIDSSDTRDRWNFTSLLLTCASAGAHSPTMIIVGGAWEWTPRHQSTRPDIQHQEMPARISRTATSQTFSITIKHFAAFDMAVS